jgi:hypothetical protein
MIAKIGRGESLFGALSYNQLKVDKENGQILYTHKMIETPDGNYSVSQLARSFEPYLAANIKTEKPVLHISLNPNPKDQVSDQKFQAIATDYMNQMGYGDQPFVVFKHTDIDRTHIHIVSVCVDEQGRKISDTFDKRRSANISRELELKYGLLPTSQNEQMKNDKIFRPVEYRKGNLKSQISSVVRHLPKYYKFQSLGEYNALLSLFNVTSEAVKGELDGVQKEGLVYSALNENGEKTGNALKASLFGKSAGLAALQKHFIKSKESLKNEPRKEALTQIVALAMQKAKNEVDFTKILQEQGINTVVRRSDQGRVYGITFVDHNSRTVWNGSRFGKEYSANVFNDWWNNNKKPGISNLAEKAVQEHHRSKDVLATENPHHLFDFLDKNVSGLFEGLGNLLPVNDGDDFEELLFENQMKKKKRRAKRKY